MKYLPDRLYSNEFFDHNCWPHIAKLAESGSIIKIAPWEHIYCIEGYGIDLSIFCVLKDLLLTILLSY